MKKTLFGIRFDDFTLDQTVMAVKEKIRNKEATHLLGVNADKINDFYSDDEWYRRVILEADIVNPDGISVILASRFLKKELPERVAGIDLMERLLASSVEENFSVYFLGAKESVLTEMVHRMKEKYPNLTVCGFRNGYFDESEWETIANEIHQCNPDIVFVGITSPKKEYLIDHFIKFGINSVFMGVGGSFDVLSGNIKRAPKWVQKIGFEWFFRMIQEPKRLFLRYFIGNSKFLVKVLKEKYRI